MLHQSGGFVDMSSGSVPVAHSPNVQFNDQDVSFAVFILLFLYMYIS